VRKQALTVWNASFHVGGPWLQGPWGLCLTGLISNMALSGIQRVKSHQTCLKM